MDGGVAALIREALARRQMSRQRLADEARISLSTLEKGLSGDRPFSLATIVRLEQALGTPLRPEAGRLVAPAELGAYARDAVGWLEGDFLALRPSLDVAGAVYAYGVHIQWDEARSCLAFAETGRLDSIHAQTGVVSAPLSAPHIYLHTNSDGQMRTAILSRPRRQGEMFGLMLTLSAGPTLRPAAFPFVLAPLPADAQLGRIHAGEPGFDRYAHLLKTAAEDHVRLVPAVLPDPAPA